MTREQENAKRETAFEEYTKLFSEKKEKEAKEYIAKNIYYVKISRELIAAYINAYSANDKEWLKDAIIAKPKYKNSAVVENGKVIYTGRKHKKTGKPLPKLEKVFTGEKSEKKFDLPTARKLFVKKYDIVTKPTSFKAKEEAEPLFDAMKDLLKDL